MGPLQALLQPPLGTALLHVLLTPEGAGRGDRRAPGSPDGAIWAPVTPLFLSASLTCLFTSTAHLEVDFPGCILQAGGTVEVPITFCPREAVSYRELVPFEVNGLCRQAVEVRGRGVEVKVR